MNCGNTRCYCYDHTYTDNCTSDKCPVSECPDFMPETRRTDDKTLIDALRILARDIKSHDGVANACIAEAAQRLEELVNERGK